MSKLNHSRNITLGDKLDGKGKGEPRFVKALGSGRYIINFGKYKGKHLDQLDSGYLMFIVNSGSASKSVKKQINLILSGGQVSPESRKVRKNKKAAQRNFVRIDPIKSKKGLGLNQHGCLSNKHFKIEVSGRVFLNFGEFKGMSLGMVDVEYLKWLLEKEGHNMPSGVPELVREEIAKKAGFRHREKAEPKQKVNIYGDKPRKSDPIGWSIPELSHFYGV